MPSRALHRLAVLLIAGAVSSQAHAQQALADRQADAGAKLFSDSCLTSLHASELRRWAREQGFHPVSNEEPAEGPQRAAKQYWLSTSTVADMALVVHEAPECGVEVRRASLSRAISNLEALTRDGFNPTTQVSLLIDRKILAGSIEYRQVAYMLKFKEETLGIVWEVIGSESEAVPVQVSFHSGVARVVP